MDQGPKYLIETLKFVEKGTGNTLELMGIGVPQ
jgi:hypothetical protein